MHTRTIHILLALLMLLPAHVLGGESPDLVTQVRLRSTVRLPIEHTQVTLGDLAKIEGPQASILQGLVINCGKPIESGTWSTLTLESLREQLKAAPEINFGAIIMLGGDTELTRLSDRQLQHKQTQTIATQADAVASPTLRDYIERWVYKRLQTTPQGTRITFNERDRSMLDTPTAGRVVEIRELGRSDLMALNIVIYERERIVLERAIRFQALVERPVLVSTAQIKRDTPISTESTRVETRWLAPTEPVADPTKSIGQVAVSTIDPGSVLISSMLEAPILIERGQIVSARSLAGSVSVSLMVRAKQSGRLGEIIELESRDRKQKFSARVAGPGRVVMMHNDQQTRATPSTSTSSLYGSP